MGEGFVFGVRLGWRRKEKAGTSVWIKMSERSSLLWKSPCLLEILIYVPHHSIHKNRLGGYFNLKKLRFRETMWTRKVKQLNLGIRS